MLNLASRLEPLVDRSLIERLENAAHVLHHPRFANTALQLDRPWEGAFCGYPTVIPERDTVHLYYRGWPGVGRDADAVTCYARSGDGGVTFERPSLGLHAIHGSKDNNAILAGNEGTHNFAPMLDAKPGVPDDQRFKSLATLHGDAAGPRGLYPFASADGVRWRRLTDQPVITRGAFDSQNVSFWSDHGGCYVAYYRTWDQAGDDPTQFQGRRTISRATSDDYLTWTDGEFMDYGDTPREELYTNQTFPYFRAPHLYLALPKRFTPGRQTLTAEQARQYDVDERYIKDVSDGVLMTSRGGNRYDRTFMEAFVRPGPDPANWVSRTNMSAQGVVQTGDRELSLYYIHRYGSPHAYLARYTLRLDGFASVKAPYEGGEMLTRPFTFTGGILRLNHATSGPGGIRVEVQDEQGQPLPGYTLEEAHEIWGDEIDRPVTWREKGSVAELAARPVRLRFVMRDADLYAIRFE